MEKKNLLVISAYTPPNPAVGGKRFAFLNQEFVRHNHEVTVLTLPSKPTADSDPSLPLAGNTIQIPSLLPLIPHPENIWAKIYNRLLVSLASPDQWIGWLLPVICSGVRQIRAKQVDMLIATGPPFTSLLAGAILARITGVPLILDYRDPWTGYMWPKKKFTNPTWHRRLETWVVHQAAGLVFVTQTMSEAFNSQFSGWLDKPIRVITNGFLPSPTSDAQKNSGTGGRKKKIIYAGNFYGERSIGLLLEPLLLLIQQGKVQKYEVEVVVFGNLPPSDLTKIHAHDAGALVQRHDPVPHEKIMEELRQGDVLYLVSGRDVSYALPYKIFDYLAAKRPILAVAPRHSEVERFMAEHRCGLFAPMDDPQRIAHALDELLTSSETDWDYPHEQYHWPHLAINYMKFIETLEQDERGQA